MPTVTFAPGRVELLYDSPAGVANAHADATAACEARGARLAGPPQVLYRDGVGWLAAFDVEPSSAIGQFERAADADDFAPEEFEGSTATGVGSPHDDPPRFEVGEWTLVTARESEPPPDGE